MSANTISKRVAEFLSKFPPFDLGTPQELQRVAEHVQINYLEADELVFEQDQAPKPYFYVVRQGSVRIFDRDENLIDICDEGDIFGVRPLLANEPYLASAQAQEECLLYAIPVEIGREILQQNPKVSLFFAMGYASGKPMQRFHQNKPKAIITTDGDALPLLSETIPVSGKKKILTCSKETTIQVAASLMADKRVGSIIITDSEGKPLGIVTDKDLRTHVATGRVSVGAPIDEIMNSPVLCVKPNSSVAECMIEMVNKQVHHLCVTEDGSIETPVVGIISDHDLLLEQGFNPAILIKEMRKSTDVPILITLRDKADELLRKYIEQEVSMHYISRMMAAINGSLLTKIIELKIAKFGQPPVNFAWLALGSQGREEQLLRTDQDHVLVFEDGDSEAANNSSQAYFLKLADEVTTELERFGFEQDVADIGANHKKWCQPLSVWKKKFSEWVSKPDENNILHSTIFFDFRCAYGDDKLARELATHLFQQLPKTQIFLPLLAKNAMSNPAPLSFFRNFVVESSGEHKDEFDLKLRAMLPLVDAARVLVLQQQIAEANNTVDRYLKLAEKDTANAELYTDAAEGYEILMAQRARFGLRDSDSGRFINPEDLSKLERQQLRTIFNTITDLQRVLKVRFQTGYLGG
jgi:CBS domain-containing protein